MGVFAGVLETIGWSDACREPYFGEPKDLQVLLDELAGPMLWISSLGLPTPGRPATEESVS
jgi:hypothetical protein